MAPLTALRALIHWPQACRQAVTPVSQSQDFIPVWPLAATAHGKYRFIAHNLLFVCTVNIIVELIIAAT